MLKNYYVRTSVLLVLFIGLVASFIGVTISICKNIVLSNSVIKEDNNIPVIKEIIEENQSDYIDTTISYPFSIDASQIVTFYKSNDDESRQQKSLILYEDTYMPSTGILYGYRSEFEVLSIYDGEVIDVYEDEIFGIIIEIKHDNDLISKYASLSSSNVEKGSYVSKGEVIGKSGKNKISTEYENELFFELSLKGISVDPTYYYNTNINELI